MTKTTINRQVDVTALYFSDKNGRLISFPKRIEYEDGYYQFVSSGLRLLVQTASGVVRIFEMTDGRQHFQLRQDQHNTWTLVSIQ